MDCDKKSWSLKYIKQFIIVPQIQKWFHINEQLTTCPPQIFPTTVSMNVLSTGWQTMSWRLFIISLHDLYNKITIALRSMPLMRSCYFLVDFQFLKKYRMKLFKSEIQKFNHLHPYPSCFGHTKSNNCYWMYFNRLFCQQLWIYVV